MEDNQGNQDGSAKEENGGKTTTTEGQSEMNQPQEEDPVKRAFQNALNQNVAASELDTPERVVTDGNAMTARDDGQQQSPQQEGAAEGGPSADKAPPSDDADDTVPGAPGTPGAQGTQGASPVSAPSPGQSQAMKKLAKTAMQEREMTAMDEHNRSEQPSSDTGVSSEETVTTQAAVPQTKKKSTKRKKKKKVKKSQTMAPPPFYQFPFFGLLPQVQAQERRKRAKKKSATRDDPAHAAPAKAAPAPAPAPPPPAPEPPAPKKIEAMKIQQKEDDNGYLNLADLQAEEKKLYGEEKKIGAPGEEYICLADANDAAAPASSGSGSKDNTNSAPLNNGSGSGKAGKAPEPVKSPAGPGAAKSPLTKEEFQDAVLTPRPGAQAKPAPGSKPPPPKETKKTSLTNDASLSRKARDKKAPPPRAGAPVTPRPASPHPHQPAPATSVGPNRHKTVRHATKEGPDTKTPQKGQPTKRKAAAPPVMPVRPPAQMDKKGVVQYPAKKASATKDEFQDAVLTPINKNPPNNNKGGGTRR